eukprot:CAMPEP_0196748576 /NCGR_PEP_ID=MMETSP1091-20130531/73896_1 /TAXON_ID=302021 /ORGANISM="Rhodomonas sp., Strain CCMP768" /LENGTH=41 /DNA_ID= /DNA_START= /DNA_END= /DNA_ORIENTATION=
MILGGMLACQEDVETNEETEPAPEVSSHADRWVRKGTPGQR